MAEFLYRCVAEGAVNNDLKSSCDFEMKFEEGPYNCPICGNELERVSSGPSISEVLRRGQREADLKAKKKGTKK
tara:strand:- start:507 stop:728 length:222 start_codon:yes stop_codon:yes gene_type:complete